MIVGTLRVKLLIREARTLKDKRQVLQSIKEKLRNSFNAAVAEIVREVAAETILFELQDPRIKNVTVTRAEVSADLQHAKVHVSVMGTQKDRDLCMHGLKHSAGYVQRKLAARLKTRFTPAVKF